MIRNIWATACAVAGLAVPGAAWAGVGDARCATPPHRPQLVCSSDACLRLETQLLCDPAVRRQPSRAHSVSPISREERSNRALDRLIASID